MLISAGINEIATPQELMNRLLAYSKIEFIKEPQFDKHWLRRYHYDKDLVENGYFFKIDDSGGDHYYILFSPAGVIIKGFDHECELSPYNFDENFPLPDCVAKHDFYKHAPAELLSLLDNPVLEKELVTFCVWRSIYDNKWNFAPSAIPEDWNDGIETFLNYTHDLEQYREDFNWYYGAEIDTTVLQSIFDRNPITLDIIATLNPNESSESVLKDLQAVFNL